MTWMAVRISVEGTDIRDITRKSLRTSYGMVLQETWLKQGTIRDNIIVGKPDATDEEVIAAAKASHAHSFIRRLPEGYDTVISEDGGSLVPGTEAAPLYHKGDAVSASDADIG